MKTKKYTAKQVDMIIRKVTDAERSKRADARKRTIASLATKLNRTPRAIDAKYCREIGRWSA